MLERFDFGPLFQTVLFIEGILLGVIGTSPISNYLSLGGFYVIKNISWVEAFGVFTAPTLNVPLLRPVSVVSTKMLYLVFGLNHFIFYLFMGTVLGCLGVVIYKFLSILNPQHRKINFLTSFLVIFSPSLLNSAWFIPQVEVLGSLFLFISLIFMTKLSKQKELNKKSILTLILFGASAITSALCGETARGFTLLVLFLYFVFLSRKEGYTKLFLTSFIVTEGVILTLNLITPVPSPHQSVKSFARVIFITYHNLSQVIYSVFVGGALILSTYSLDRIFGKISWLLSSVLVLFSFLAVPFFEFSYMGMTFFSASSLIPLLIILFLFSLTTITIYDSGFRRFCALAVLLSVFAIIIVSLLIHPSTSHVSTRVYSYIIPFLVFLVVDSLSKLLNKYDFNSLLSHRNFFGILPLSIIILLFLTYPVVSAYNISQERSSRSIVNYELKNRLAEMNLENSTLMYTYFGYRPSDAGLEVLNRRAHLPSSIKFLNHFHFSEDLKSECNRSGINQLYIFMLRKKYSSGKRSRLLTLSTKGFRWTAETGFAMFKSDEEIPAGFIPYHERTIYSHEIPLQSFLEKRNASLIYEKAVKYKKVLRWMIDVPWRVYNKIPLIPEYEYHGRLYQVKCKKLMVETDEPEHNSSSLR